MDSGELPRRDEADVRRWALRGEPEEDEIDLRAWARTLWRRKGLLLTPALLGTLIAAVVAFRMDNTYTAGAEVLIDPGREQVANIEEVVTGVGRDRAAINTEIDVITSRDLAVRVVRALDLERYPDFNPSLRPEDPLAVDITLNPFAYLPAAWRDWLRGDASAEERAVQTPADGSSGLGAAGFRAGVFEEDVDARTAAMANALRARLNVRPKGDYTRVIRIEATASSPKLAARLANGVAELYLEEQLEAKYGATRRATRWLNKRVDELKQQVQDAEQAVAAYRKTAGLIQSGKTTVTSQQLSELNSELILSQTKRAEAEARLEQIQRQIDEGGIQQAAKMLDSSLIDKLRAQRAELQRRKAELASEYGPKHPRMINITAEIDDVAEQIRAEVQKILQNVRNDVEVARTRERTLRQKVSELESQTANLNSKEVQLRQLEREAEASRQLYETFLARLKETSAKEGTQTSDARVISHADTPSVPSGPNREAIVTMAFALSLGFGLMLVVVMEKLDRGLRSSEQVEQLTGVPGLGLVPLVARRGRKVKELADAVVKASNSAYAEALRNLHVSLLLSDLDHPPRLVLVTSTVPGEGKSATVASMARVMAQAGHSVLMVDGDLRRPQLHTTFKVPRGPGLVEVLSGETSLETALQKDAASGAYLLTAGRQVHNPADLLASERTRRVLQELGRGYDLVLLDAPPAGAVVDARILGTVADTTLFLVRWGETPRERVALALKQLKESGTRIGGVALSMVNVRKHAQYSYADSGHYCGAYAKYYGGKG